MSGKKTARRLPIVEAANSKYTKKEERVDRSETRAGEWPARGLHAHSRQCNTRRRRRRRRPFCWRGSLPHRATRYLFHTNLGIRRKGREKRLKFEHADDRRISRLTLNRSKCCPTERTSVGFFHRRFYFSAHLFLPFSPPLLSLSHIFQKATASDFSQ